MKFFIIGSYRDSEHFQYKLCHHLSFDKKGEEALLKRTLSLTVIITIP
jgi:hypothetical protein